MFSIIWHYTINPRHRDSFIEHYHAEGVWVKFFRQSPYYFETDFFAVGEDQFITIDKWTSEQVYEKFLEDHQYQYNVIDASCEKFTIEEQLVGRYYLLQ